MNKDNEYLYPTSLFIDENDKWIDGIMTAQQIVETIRRYKGKEFDDMLLECMKMAIKDGCLIEDEKDPIRYHLI